MHCLSHFFCSFLFLASALALISFVEINALFFSLDAAYALWQNGCNFYIIEKICALFTLFIFLFQNELITICKQTLSLPYASLIEFLIS